MRIEDIDVTRCTPEFEQGIFRDLELAGRRMAGTGTQAIQTFCRL